ncbi:MAG: dihydroneopterin aldolase [Alphaproteobacteria bacterium]|nr:dihydroneopterin aldolase [Alphaproteobacteria bacterium]
MTGPRLVHAQAVADQGVGIRRVLVRDMLLEARIGVHKHERDAPQQVRVNLELSVREGGPIRDRLADVVDYEKIVHGARRVAESRHINLVETLAEELAEICFDDARVLAVRVRVEKLGVFEDVASVGVEIERFNEGRLPAEIEWFNQAS